MHNKKLPNKAVRLLKANVADHNFVNITKIASQSTRNKNFGEQILN